MNDRGEKIINLAREMLRTDMDIRPEAVPAKPAISLKVLCLATALTALGSSVVTEAMSETHRPLNRYEKTELKAFVLYTARLKNTDEDSVRHDVEQKLGVGSLDDLTMGDLHAARAYLQAKAQ